MKFVEFVADIEDGIIKVPKKCLKIKQPNKVLHITIFAVDKEDEELINKKPKRKKYYINAPGIDTRGLFDRDEAIL